MNTMYFSFLAFAVVLAAALFTVWLGRYWGRIALSERLKILFFIQKYWSYVACPVLILLGPPLIVGGLWLTPILNPLAHWEVIPAVFFGGMMSVFGVSSMVCGVTGLFHAAAATLHHQPETERGRRLVTLANAQKSVRDMAKPQSAPLCERPPTVSTSKAPTRNSQNTLRFGMLELPEGEASHNFLVAGSIGSGKTLTILMLMRSAFALFRRGVDCRALVFDAKREYYSRIVNMGLEVPIRTFDPFDIRCVAWDMAADITTEADAKQLAHLLIPEVKGETQPYFSTAARSLAEATVVALQSLDPKAWSLRDLILITQDSDRLRGTLEKVPAAFDPVRQHFEAREFSSVLSTLATKLGPLTVVAALWDGAAERYSLKTWLNECSVLMLAADPVHREALETINRAIFARISNLLLSQNKNPPGRHWLFLDEFREAGVLDGVRSVMNLGRSKGVAAVLGFQDFDGLCALYGTKEANEITGQCNNKTFLRTDSTATAAWMEGHAGKILVQDPQMNVDPKGSSIPNSLSIHRVERHLVMASEFMEIPRTTVENGLKAFHLIPASKTAYWTHNSLEEILPLVGEPHPNVPNHVGRLADSQRLAPWSHWDARRIGIPFATPSSPKSSASDQPKASSPPPGDDGEDPAKRLRGVRRRDDPPPEERL